MDMQAAIKELQETAIVMSGIQARQAEVLKVHGEWLEQNERWMTRHREAMAEFDDKLNGLIGIVDGLIRGRDKE